MKTKIFAVFGGLLLCVLTYVYSFPWWLYLVGLVISLVSLAILSADAQPDNKGYAKWGDGTRSSGHDGGIGGE